MKDTEKQKAVLRIKINKIPLLIHAPGDRQDYVVLQPSDEWHEAANHPHLSEWMILPRKEDRGLPLRRWLTLWDDEKVEIEVQNADGSWSNLF